MAKWRQELSLVLQRATAPQLGTALGADRTVRAAGWAGPGARWRFATSSTGCMTSSCRTSGTGSVLLPH
eukprot:7424875-Pyramimonas_sp.AAC.1